MKSKGQSTVEAILIALVLMGAAGAVSSAFKSNELLNQLVGKPWQSVAGMIQNGAWGSPQRTFEEHPNFGRKHRSFKPDP